MLPKIYPVRHPRTPWLVIFTNPDERDARGKPRRVQKWFAVEAEARAHHRKLIEETGRVGLAGLGFAAHERADFFAARQLLAKHGHERYTLVEIVRHYCEAIPAARVPSDVAMADLFADFIRAKAHEENRREATVRNLRNRVGAWLRRQQIESLAQINETTIRAIKQRAGVSAQTRLTDMTAVSSFCGWLVQEKHLAANPLRGVKRPQTDHVVPRALTAAQVGALLESARTSGGGRLLRAFALMLLAGLRPGEVEHLDAAQVNTATSRPLLRVHTGKRRRLIRVLPLSPAFGAWWGIAAAPEPKPGETTRPPIFSWARDRWLHARILEGAGLVERARPAGKITRSDWQADICRHTYISWRVAITHDENLVALEAGTSVAIIHAHYLALMTTAEARAISQLRPKRLTAARETRRGDG